MDVHVTGMPVAVILCSLQKGSFERVDKPWANEYMYDTTLQRQNDAPNMRCAIFVC